jgi:hypothetical protein
MFASAPAPTGERAALHALQREHGVLLRQLARLQRELSPVLQRLQQENLRLRAAVLVQRTAWLWGLKPPIRTAVPRGSGAGGEQGSQDWLCQVGCSGHAHAWLQPDGRCKRHGRLCVADATADGKAAVEAPQAESG